MRSRTCWPSPSPMPDRRLGIAALTPACGLVAEWPPSPNPPRDLMKPSAPGIILIVIGGLFLLRNLGVDLRLGQLFATWWPLALIALGLGMLFRRPTK